MAGQAGSRGAVKEAAEWALTASVVATDRHRVLVEVSAVNNGGASILIALADTGASTSFHQLA